MKKPTRRSNSQYPALDPKLNLKTRQNLLDYDYIDQLNEKDKQWLNDFSEEYVNADFKINEENGRKRIHKKKKSSHPKNEHLKKLIVDFTNHIKQFIQILNNAQITNTTRSKFKKSTNKFKKQLKVQIQKEFKYILDSYKTSAEHANNHRNMCIITTQSAQGRLKAIEVIPETFITKKDTEDQLITMIDNKKLGIKDED